MFKKVKPEQHPHNELKSCPDCGSAAGKKHKPDAEIRTFERDWTAFYNAAIAYVEQSKMPTVGYSVNKRASAAYSDQYSEERLMAPICFLCAHVLAYDGCDSTCGKGVIQVLHACFVHPRAILNLPICAGSSSSIVVCSSLIPTIDLAICFQYCLIGFCSHSHD